MAAEAIPMERTLDRLPAAQLKEPAPDGAAPLVAPGHAGKAGDSEMSGSESGLPAEEHAPPGPLKSLQTIPQNYGDGNRNTQYHYNDYKLIPHSRKYPYRASGKFYFQKESGGPTFWCSATLIAPSIILTAGHCVHDGGNRSDGWFHSGWFAPAHEEKFAPYGRFGYCNARAFQTTSGWYNEGDILQGYDVGLIACDKRVRRNGREMRRQFMGDKVGWLSFCTENCRQLYWFMTQLGYPGNYYDGDDMTVSQHLEDTTNDHTTSEDYVYGSGMRGGSSGGPHISNIGFIEDSASAGEWPFRNVILAVTSWGYVGDTFKIQGASPLSGVQNANDFPGMYNSICRWARKNLGKRSRRACNLL